MGMPSRSGSLRASQPYATPLLASDENDCAFGADTENDWEVAASEYWALPTCVAVTVQVPDPTKLHDTRRGHGHTDGLDELNVRPEVKGTKRVNHSSPSCVLILASRKVLESCR